VVAWHVDSGQIDGVDVGGRTIALLGFVPGNILQGNWKAAVFVDDKASDAQTQALGDAFTGKLGGPLADTAQLIGEVVAFEKAPITYEIREGKGTLRVGAYVDAEMEPYRGPTGQVTTLHESIFTTIPGAPAWVGKASRYVRKSSQFGLKDIDLRDHNAIQGSFRFVHN
jgi:hypothetical protein